MERGVTHGLSMFCDDSIPRIGQVTGLLLLPKISNFGELLDCAMIILGSIDEAGLPESMRVAVYATEKQTNSQRGFGKWV